MVCDWPADAVMVVPSRVDHALIFFLLSLDPDPGRYIRIPIHFAGADNRATAGRSCCTIARLLVLPLDHDVGSQPQPQEQQRISLCCSDVCGGKARE